MQPCQCPKGSAPIGFVPDPHRLPIVKESLGLPQQAFILRNVLSPTECAQIISDSETRGYDSLADIYQTSYRDNERVIVSDAAFADTLYSRVRAELPRMDGHDVVGLNECFRSCKYAPGGHFKPHNDKCFVREDERELSRLTFMMYLNGGFGGGHTNFLDVGRRPIKSVTPEPGLVLVFEHNTLHEGGVLLDGVKYIFRSDVMYTNHETF